MHASAVDRDHSELAAGGAGQTPVFKCERVLTELRIDIHGQRGRRRSEGTHRHERWEKISPRAEEGNSGENRGVRRRRPGHSSADASEGRRSGEEGEDNGGRRHLHLSGLRRVESGWRRWRIQGRSRWIICAYSGERVGGGTRGGSRGLADGRRVSWLSASNKRTISRTWTSLAGASS